MKPAIQVIGFSAMLCLLVLNYYQANPSRSPGIGTYGDINGSRSLGIGAYGDINDIDSLKTMLHNTITQKLENGRLILESDGKSYSLWRNDPQGSLCRNYVTRFGQDLPRVRLVSYPCSGNTWTRYLLEAATGVFTGSTYNSILLFKAGYLGEIVDQNNGSTLVQKTHGASLRAKNLNDYQERYELIDGAYPAILLIRNPARAIVSYWHYRKTGSKFKEANEESFGSQSFHQFFNNGVARWESLILDRLLGSTAPVYILYYEDLVAHPIPTIKNLLHFLGAPVDEDRLACVSSHLKGSFKRPGGHEVDPYNTKERELLATAATKINRTLQLLGYQPLPFYS